MASHTTPDFKGPRRSGDYMTPDAKSPSPRNIRGQYPDDKGGPPEFKVGKAGPQGDYQTAAVPVNKQVQPKAPRKTTDANTLTNPLR